MATDLTGLKVQNTYNALLKIGDNSDLTGIAKVVSDGVGHQTVLYLSTSQVGIGGVPDAGVGLHVHGNVKVGNIETTGYLRAPATFTIDPAAHGDDTGVVVIAGDLRVDGTTTTINSTVVSVDDKNILLGDGATADSDNNGAGITVLRPSLGSTNSFIQWNETTDQWDFSHSLNLSLNTTTDLSEGTNLYYTDARFDNRLSTKTTDNLSEGSSNLYFTTARARASFSGGTGVTITSGSIAIGQSVGTTDNVTFGNVTGNSFIKSGGTSSQFLKADGSVDSSTYLTSYTETDTLQSVTDRGATTTNDITIGDGTAANNLYVKYSDGSYSQLRGTGLYLNRTTSYIRPTTDATTTLYIGFDDGATINNPFLKVRTYAVTHEWYNDASERMTLSSAGDLDVTRDITAVSFTGNVFSTNGGTTPDIIGGVKIARLHGDGGTAISSIDNLDTFILSKKDGSYGSGTKPTGSNNAFGVISLQTHSGNYYTQLGLDTNQNQLWIRSANGTTTFGSWETFLNSGNYEGVFDAHYLRSDEDDTMTGNLTVVGNVQATTARLTTEGQANLTSTAHGFQIGDGTTTDQLLIDNNTMMVRNNGAGADMFLNSYGGDVFVGVQDANTTLYVTNNLYSVIHSGNIGSQSVNYATTAGSATTATNADTVDSKHATDFTLDYVTNNGASTVNSIAIGQTTTTSHKLYINGGTSTNIPLKIKSENTSTSGYAEMHIANDAEYKLILGSIGTNYSSTDWADSSYIYDTDQSYLRIKASNEMQLFSGGYTVASHKTLTLQSDGDVVVERGKLYTNNIYTSDTIYFNRGDSDFSNIIRSQGYPSGGYTASNQKYWLEYSTKGGHHFVVNTDGGAGSSENNYDDFTIWQGSVDGDRLLSVSNVGNTDIYGNLHVHNDGTFTEQIDGVALYLDSISESYATRLRFRKNTNDFWSIDSRGTSEGNDLKFYRYNAGWDTVMTMDWANGYVGIQTDPSYPLHVAGKIYSTTEVQGGAATMRSYGGYAFFGSNSLSVPIAIGRDGTEYDIKITASGNTELGGNLKTETIGGSETISVSNQAGQRTMMPKNGAKFLGNSSTGAIRLKSPINAHIDSFHTFKGTIYQYQAGGTFEFLISGYYSGTTWYNTSATIKGTSDKNFTVRFGRDSNNAPLVYIGETTSTWSYAYVYLSEVNYGWTMSQPNMDNYMNGWTISGSHTTFENVTATTSDALITSWSRNGNSVYYTNPVAIGSNTTYAPLDVTSSTSGSSGVVQYSYNSSPSSYRLRLDTEVSSGLVKWKWNMLNGGTSYNDVMVFDRGKIGIGDSSPLAKFEVLGSIKSTSRDVAHTGEAGVTLSYDTSEEMAYIETWQSKPLTIRTYNSQHFNIGGKEVMLIESNGNWINNYSGTRFWHNSTSYYTAFNNTNEINTYTSGGAASMMYLNYNGGDVNIAKSGIVAQGNAGNVGIGITSPNQKLDVDGSVKIGTWATSGSRYVGFGRNDTGVFGTGGASGLEIESVFASGNGNYDQNVHLWTHWYNGGSNRTLTATWNKKVGINTTSPNGTFQVNGSNFDFTVNYDANSAISMTSIGTTGGYNAFTIGLANNTNNTGVMRFAYAGSGSTSNKLNFGFYANDDILQIQANRSVIVDGSLYAAPDSFDPTPNGTTFTHTLAASATTNRVVNFDGNGANPSVWWNNGNSAKGAIDALDEGLAFWCNNNSGGWYRNFYIEPDRTIFERNVGIGVTSPSPYKLNVSGETHLNNGTGTGLTINTTVADNNTRNAIQLYEDDGQATGRQAIMWYNGNMSYVKARLWTEVGSSYANTKFGIDVADNARSVSTRLWIYNGDTYMSGDVIAYASSDKRLKDNIKPIENAIDKVKKIGGYEFDWNDKQESHKGHDVGVIAQEIEEVLPELVTTRDNGYKAVKYEKLVALLIEGMKEQQQQIDMQQQQIDELKKTN